MRLSDTDVVFTLVNSSMPGRKLMNRASRELEKCRKCPSCDEIEFNGAWTFIRLTVLHLGVFTGLMQIRKDAALHRYEHGRPPPQRTPICLRQ